jgi:hypothetical protein
MKRLIRFAPITATALLLALFCGCGKSKSNDQGAKPAPAAPAPAPAVARARASATATNHPIDAREIETPGFQVPGRRRGAPAKIDNILKPDGTIYEGEMTDDGKPNGMGHVAGLNGTDQRGEWRNGQPYRIAGTWIAPDGTKEVGTWNMDGTPSGGTITWADGKKYVGDWRIALGDEVDSPHGMGVMTWTDGRTYTGEFHNGEVDGYGKMTWPDGKVEDGAFQQGKFIATP